MAAVPAPPVHTDRPGLLGAALVVAVAGPALLAWNEPPVATFYNQALALAGWCAVVMWLSGGLPARDLLYRGGLGLLWSALGLLLAAAVMAPVWAALPWGMALAAAGMILLAGLAASTGAAVSQARRTAAVFLPLAWVLAATGLASAAIAWIQLYAPGWADGTVIARSGAPGRAVGNLRQANHLASLLLWSAIAIAWLGEIRLRRGTGDPGLARTRGDAAAAGEPRADPSPARGCATDPGRAVALALLWAAWVAVIGGVVLSGSRTGLLGVGVLALWGLLDRGLARPTRVLLLAAPLVALAAWALHGTAAAPDAGSAAAALARTGSDISSSRFAIWRNTLALIAQHPWLGVGFGEFNFAWTLTPFPDRPVAFFDHAHNLVLQLWVELGLPLGTVVLVLLGGTLWRALGQARRQEGEVGLTIRAAFVAVALMALHSQLEYPLWYAHFLLPTAFLLGLCIAGQERRSLALRPDEAARGPVRTGWMAALIGLLVVAGAVWDYQRVVAIFKPPTGAAPLAERIAEGRRSWFFAHHADYAAATTAKRPSDVMPAFDRAAHHLLDARLLRAWAQAMDETNQVDRSRHLAQRLAEFRNPAVAEFFAVCAAPPTAASAGGADAESAAGAAGVDAAPALGSAVRSDTGSGSSASAAASWVEMAASFPAPVSPADLPRGPPAPPPDPAFVARPQGLPFQCLKPTRVLSYEDFR